MKKVFSILLMLVCMTSMLFAQEKIGAKAAEVAIATANVSTAAEMINNNLVNGTSALHQDAVNGVSTLHQDLVGVATTIYPDAKGVINTLYSDGKRAIDYLVPKVESVITALAQGLKTTTAEVWRILVYKQVALATTSLIYLLISLLIIAAYLVGVSKVLKATTAQGGIWNVGHQAFVIMGGVFAALLLASCAAQVPVIVNGFMVPEAGALKEAIDLTQQLLGSFK